MSVEIEKILGDLSGYLAGRDININLDPARIEALEKEIATLKAAQQMLSDSAEIKEKISDKEADLVKDYFSKAVQALLDDDLAEARRYFEQVRSLDPADEQAAALLRAVETKLKAQGQGPLPEPTPLRAAYLNRILETSSHLSLTGIDPKAASSEADARLNLSAVYTALLTLSPEHHEQLLLGKKLGRDTPRLSALAQLDRHHHLVLLGDPGSGKSTFVNFVAMCLAGEALERPDANMTLLTAPLPNDDGEDADDRQPWSHGPLLPVRVILRDFAARGLPPAGQPATAQHLWRFVTAELEQGMLSEYAKDLGRELHQRGGLLLLDGLDEVPEADRRRAQIKQAVEDFARTFGKCRILVTSRTYAYQKQDWRLPGFKEAVLASFSPGQIRRFVTRWYAHIALLRGLDADDAQGRATLLKQAIFNSNRLRELAERPLLLTLMASLHAWRGGSLPEKREELYSDTVDLLLEWWERPKVVKDAQGQTRIEQPSLAEWLRVDRDKVRSLLDELAYQAHASQPETVGTADVAGQELVAGLMDLSQNPDVNPARLVEYLRDRAGLLVGRGNRVYTFPHRTIQEYLAACHLTGQDDFPAETAGLVRSEPNRWREVALLAGAKAVSGMAAAIWLLVDELCGREVEETYVTATDLTCALIAAQAMLETAALTRLSDSNQRRVARIRGWLKNSLTTTVLPAVERVAAGDLLARLGDDRPGVGLNAKGLPDIVWRQIPAGPFLMGSDKNKDSQAYDDELPQHQVTLPDYEISRYPVTHAQFQAFVADGGYTEARYWAADAWREGEIKIATPIFDDEDKFTGKWEYEWVPAKPRGSGEPYNLPNHPMVGVNWYEAVAFCHWLSERLGQTIRLPTEAEWEKAVRGTDGRIFPWGDEADPERMNYNETGIGTTSAVGCFAGGISPYGCQDMAGNVWEWCATAAGEDWNELELKPYPYDVTENEWSEEYQNRTSVRVLRGGAFGFRVNFVRAPVRLRNNPSSRYSDDGFRLVRAPI